ncbi:MAG: hypothetical protein ABH844_03150 [Candidatus Omnitrophota bacterium]
MKKYKTINSINHVEFYCSAFSSTEKAKGFIDHIKKINGHSKIILYQTARMIYLAEIIHQKGRPSLQVLFFLIAAEAVAKLAYNFRGEGKSRHYVKKFFKNICNTEHQNKLSRAFRKQITEIDFMSENYLTIDETIDFLYAIRCDVVHRGIYFDNLSLKDNLTDENELFTWNNQSISPNISTNDLCNIIIEGTIIDCRMALPENDAYKN